MKLPKLAAQYAIGPAIGDYLALAPAAPGGTATLVPMVGVAQQLDLNQSIEQIVNQKGQSQCGAAQRTCWGSPMQNKSYWYICCDNGQNCGFDVNGYPTCV
jgi:hypothetical protein